MSDKAPAVGPGLPTLSRRRQHAVLEELALAATRACNASAAVLTLLTGPEPQVLAHAGEIPGPIHQGLAGLVQDRSLVAIPDTRSDDRFDSSWQEHEWAAVLSAPIRGAEPVLGQIVVLDVSARHWSPEDESAVAAIADAVRAYLVNDPCAIASGGQQLLTGGPHVDVLLGSSTLFMSSATSDGILSFADGKTEELIGLAPSEMVGRHVRDVFAAFPDVVQDLMRALTGTPFRVARAFGDRWLDLSYQPLIHNGRTVRVDVVGLDVTAQHRLREDVQRLSHHDPLTGLLNRPGLERQLGGVLRTRRGQRPRDLAYVLIDLDGFGEINGDLGPDVGSEILIQVADRLRMWAKAGVMLARTGSDEFAAVLPDNLLRRTPLDEAIQELRAALAAPFQVQPEPLHVTADIGVARGPATDSAHLLVAHAEAALDQAKKQGRAQTVFWTPGLSTSGTVNLAGRLRAAIDQGDIHVHYQPVICTMTGRVRAVEALARWTDSEQGAVPPDVFIGLAERSGMIKDLGALVLRTALRDVQRWDLRLVPRVSVNVSAGQLQDPGFARLVREAVADSGTSADRLILEITESALGGERANAVQALQSLRSDGIRVAVDDFGTGFSSLARLKNLPLDAMKVDREFIRDLPDPAAERLLHGIVQIATALQLDTIVEGVETADQERSASAAGAHGAQGWLYARAMPAAELTTWLLRQSTGRDEA